MRWRRLLRLRDFLLRINERLLDDDCSSRSGWRDNLDLRPDPRMLYRNPRVADVLLQARRHRKRGERADLLSVFPNRPWFRQPGTNHLIPRDLDANEFSFHALPLDLRERLLPDEVRLLVYVHEPAESCRVRVRVWVDVGWTFHDSRLDPALFLWVGRLYLVRC